MLKCVGVFWVVFFYCEVNEITTLRGNTLNFYLKNSILWVKMATGENYLEICRASAFFFFYTS